ncbi:MAG TPA: prepilin-type N-terminal cleavage/methylation domain-containing protein [Planctomycetota bacterium]|nr:prepilin-type N-terminal cleavage/methylation domain-containing protein [Planctomycetota bacterium]
MATACPNRKQAPESGMTLLEVLIAMFIFLIGIVGVLAVVPTGVNAASLVIFQDAAIHLSSSKFAEFRRDEINAAVDLQDGSAYLSNYHEPHNGSAEKFRNFASGPGQRYEHFDEIQRYEWKVDQDQLRAVNLGEDELKNPAPVESGGAPLLLTRVTVVIHMKGTSRYMRFTQYMLGK